jgi:hypothetical protein
MPIVALHLQKHFKVNLLDGLITASVTANDAGRWLMCCPLCGCTHDVSAADASKPYAPMCQAFPAIFKSAQVAWQKLHPEVAQYKTLRLVPAQ